MAGPRTLSDMWPSLRRILRRFGPELGKHRLLAGGSLLLLWAEIFLRVLEPWPLKFVFDRVVAAAPSKGASRVPFVDAMDSGTLLALSAVAIVLLTGSRALAAYGNTVGFARIGNRVLNDVRGALYRHLQCLSLSYHARARSGDLVVRVIGDIGLLKDVVVTAILPLLANLMILVAMAGVMLWVNWKLAVVALCAYPVFWFLAMRAGREIREVSRKQRRREGTMAATAAQSIGAIKAVQALSLEEVLGEEFRSVNRKSGADDVKAKRLEANLERTTDVLIAVATASVLFYGANLVMRAVLTPGDLLVFLAYLNNAYKPVRSFAKYTARLAKASAAGDRVLDVLEESPEVQDLPGAVPAPPFRGEVRFEGVSFGYEDGRKALDGIDLAVRPGERVALVGPSGAGKSTFASLILRLYDPAEGRVTIDGQDIRRFTLSSVRSQVAVVLEDPMLFAASVRENIAYGAPDASMEEIEAAARLAEAHDFIEALPEGYDTVVGERGVTLSTGQCQRIAVARAAVRKSPILILDEPTRGLDTENGAAVVEALERLSGGRTTVLITHDMEFAARADRVVLLAGGRIAEQGTHAGLIRAGGKYAALCAIRAGSGSVPGSTEEPHAFSP
ncbi:MAG: ABC transporter ATP-binding protein [Deltaproteobacteria bacterium]|nr:ABC transporter ATP-binding protein [Deltaproteobacteria bacterium]